MTDPADGCRWRLVVDSQSHVVELGRWSRWTGVPRTFTLDGVPHRLPWLLGEGRHVTPFRVAGHDAEMTRRIARPAPGDFRARDGFWATYTLTVDGVLQGSWVARSADRGRPTWTFVEPGSAGPDATMADWPTQRSRGLQTHATTDASTMHISAAPESASQPATSTDAGAGSGGTYVVRWIRSSVAPALHPRHGDTPQSYLTRMDLPPGIRLSVLPAGALPWVQLEPSFDADAGSWTWSLTHDEERARWSIPAGDDVGAALGAAQIVAVVRALLGSPPDEPLHVAERRRGVAPVERLEGETDGAYLSRAIDMLRERGPGGLSVTVAAAGVLPAANVGVHQTFVTLSWSQVVGGPRRHPDREWRTPSGRNAVAVQGIEEEIRRTLGRPAAGPLVVSFTGPAWDGADDRPVTDEERFHALLKQPGRIYHATVARARWHPDAYPSVIRSTTPAGDVLLVTSKRDGNSVTERLEVPPGGTTADVAETVDRIVRGWLEVGADAPVQVWVDQASSEPPAIPESWLDTSWLDELAPYLLVAGSLAAVAIVAIGVLTVAASVPIVLAAIAILTAVPVAWLVESTALRVLLPGRAAYRSETGGSLDAVSLLVILGWIGLVAFVLPVWL